MVLSPLLAAVALLIPVAADWGAYKYLPAVVWSLLFVQCLITFRWRGLWFLLGLPVAFLAIEAFLLAAPPVPRKEPQPAAIGLESQNATRPGTTDQSASMPVTEPPLIIRNPDGTFTIQKQAPTGTKDDSQGTGLRIPPQVVVPFARTPDRK
jgi:hypothetical protein